MQEPVLSLETNKQIADSMGEILMYEALLHYCVLPVFFSHHALSRHIAALPYSRECKCSTTWRTNSITRSTFAAGWPAIRSRSDSVVH